MRLARSTSTRWTRLPSVPVCAVISVEPIIWSASSATFSTEFATLTPPPLPRPPAWIWAFTTQRIPPSSSATRAAGPSAGPRISVVGCAPSAGAHLLDLGHQVPRHPDGCRVDQAAVERDRPFPFLGSVLHRLEDPRCAVDLG